MSPIERQELADAMTAINQRFETVEDDIGTIKTDLAFIKGATKFVTVFLTIAVPATIAVLGWLVK
jgi:hypothetical protein